MVRTFFLLTLSALCAGTDIYAASFGASPGAARRELQIRQQQDALNLNLQQSIGRRNDLAPADQRRLDQLELDQRIRQQQLEQNQLVRGEQLRNEAVTLPHGIGDSQLRAQRDIFTQERTLQLQQFEVERQRLLNSAPREPLQTPAGGALRMPY